MRASLVEAIVAATLLWAGSSFPGSRCNFFSYRSLRTGVSEGKAIRQSVQPEYPTETQRRRVQGLVNLPVLSDADGIVQKACATSGHQLLRAASEAAALKTVFEPVLTGKRRLMWSAKMSFSFVLPKESSPSEGESPGPKAG